MKRLLALLTAVAIAGLVLTACGGASQPTPPANQPQDPASLPAG